jgi:EmrB/QacA subfamily drug resistance transporter
MSTPTATSRPGQPVSDGDANHARRWWILAVLGVAQLMVILDNTIVNIALPTAQHSLNFSNADRQWVVTGYSLAFGSLLLLGGRIGDIIGRKRALLIGLIGFALASALGGASVNFPMLVTARSIQGAFGAVLAPSVLALLTTTFTDPAERGKAFAIYGGIAGAGGAIGLLLGGILTSYASWRWTLFVNLVFAAIAGVGALMWLRNDRAADRDPLDIPGLLLVTGGLFCLVYGFSHAETTAWSDPFTVGFLIVGVVLLGVFALVQSRRRFPLLPLRIVRNRTRGGSLLTMLFASAGVFGVFLFLTYYMQGTLGFSPVKTGVAFLPLVVGLAGMAQVSNRLLLPKVGPKIIVPVGLILDAVAMVEFHQLGLHSSYFGRVFPFLLLLGIGFGLSLAPSFSTGTIGLAPHDAGVGSAALNTSQQVGGSVGTALLNTLAASAAASYAVGKVAGPATLRAAALHSYTTAFLWSAIIFAAGAVLVALVFQRGNLATLAGPAPSFGADATGDPAEPIRLPRQGEEHQGRPAQVGDGRGQHASGVGPL